MTADLSALIAARNVIVGSVGLYVLIRFGITILRAKQGEGE